MLFKYPRAVVLALSLTALPGAFAAEPLPKSMGGRWAATLSSGQQIGNIWSLTVEKLDGSGRFEGKLTYYGAFCGAKNEPMTGTFDGSELRINSSLRANTNTDRAGGQCGTGKAMWLLKKQPGRQLFEGEGELEGIPVKTRVYLNP